MPATPPPRKPAPGRSPIGRFARLPPIAALLTAPARAAPWPSGDTASLPAGAGLAIAVALLVVIGVLGWRLRRARIAATASLHTQQRLQEELQVVTRRLMRVQEDERSALSSALHDDIGQAITAMKLAAAALPGADPRRQQAIVDDISTSADQANARLRDLSQLLRPRYLDTLGLAPALHALAAQLTRSSGIPITVDIITPLPARLPPAVELACLRIAQEALTNALRHAGARAIQVQLALAEDALQLQVDDDGRGCDAAGAQGLGLLTMRERAQQLGGRFQIAAAPAGGTRVHAHLPLAAPR